MKLAYHQATISFSLDLTAPDAEALPIANLLVGEAGERVVAGIAVLVPEHLDPISKAVLNDTHQLIRTYVDDAFQERSPDAPLSEVLTRVYHSLRNTMHVSAIGPRIEHELDAAAQLGPTVIELLHRGLLQALDEAGYEAAPVSAEPASGKQPWLDPASLELPPSFVWTPPGPSGIAAAG